MVHGASSKRPNAVQIYYFSFDRGMVTIMLATSSAVNKVNRQRHPDPMLHFSATSIRNPI